MHCRVLPFSIAALAAVYSASVFAQAAPAPPAVAPAVTADAAVTHAEFKQAIDDLKFQIQSLKSPSSVAPASGAEQDLAGRVAALERQVAELHKASGKLLDITADQEKMLGDIAKGRMDATGNKHFVPNVQAIRDDQDSRSQLVDTVVHDMARSTGELKIRNEMGVGQSVVVNGTTTVYVPANSTQSVTVPAGTATTQLAGEGAKSWMIGAPSYFQEIIIAPIASNVATAAWHYDPTTGVWWRTLP
jgi:hypothetical protein